MPDQPGIPVDDDNPQTIDLLTLRAIALEYLQFRRGRESLQRSEDDLKKDVMAGLSTEKPDEKGNRFLYFNEPNQGVEGIKRERRVSQILDEDAAMVVVKKYGLEEKCLETIVVLNEDGLLAANFDGTIPDEEMKALYSEKETFALVLVKEQS